MSEFDHTTAPPPPPPADGGPSAEERQWALFAHLSVLLGGLVTAGWLASFGCVVGPLMLAWAGFLSPTGRIIATPLVSSVIPGRPGRAGPGTPALHLPVT